MSRFASGNEMSRALGIPVLHSTKLDTDLLAPRSFRSYTAWPFQSGAFLRRLYEEMSPDHGVSGLAGSVIWIAGLSGTREHLPWAIGLGDQLARAGIDSYLLGDCLGEVPGRRKTPNSPVPTDVALKIGSLLPVDAQCVHTDVAGVHLVSSAERRPSQSPKPSEGPFTVLLTAAVPGPDELLPETANGVIFAAAFADHEAKDIESAVRRMTTAELPIVGLIALDRDERRMDSSRERVVIAPKSPRKREVVFAKTIGRREPNLTTPKPAERAKIERPATRTLPAPPPSSLAPATELPTAGPAAAEVPVQSGLVEETVVASAISKPKPATPKRAERPQAERPVAQTVPTPSPSTQGSPVELPPERAAEAPVQPSSVEETVVASAISEPKPTTSKPAERAQPGRPAASPQPTAAVFTPDTPVKLPPERNTEAPVPSTTADETTAAPPPRPKPPEVQKKSRTREPATTWSRVAEREARKSPPRRRRISFARSEETEIPAASHETPPEAYLSREPKSQPPRSRSAEARVPTRPREPEARPAPGIVCELPAPRAEARIISRRKKRMRVALSLVLALVLVLVGAVILTSRAQEGGGVGQAEPVSDAFASSSSLPRATSNELLAVRTAPPEVSQAGGVGAPTEGSELDYFVLQFSSFPSHEDATIEVERLSDLEIDAIEIPVDIPGKGTWFRVVSGRFHSRAEARTAASRLREQNGLTDIHIGSRGGYGAPSRIW